MNRIIAAVVLILLMTYAVYTDNKNDGVRLLLIEQHDCYLVGEKNPGAYNSQPVYRCGNLVIPQDKLIEKLKPLDGG